MRLLSYGEAVDDRLPRSDSGLEAVAVWAAAKTLGHLGELTARWLEGAIAWIPTSGDAGPDPETEGLIPVLAAINRSGFLTDFSQPGVPVESGSGQRASLMGFCSEESAQTLAFACLTTDLLCLLAEPGSSQGPWIPVTIDGGLAYTWVPPPVDSSFLTDDWPGLSHAGLVALMDAWQVAVVDPVWGRDDLLWPVVRDALAGPSQRGALPPGGDTE